MASCCNFAQRGGRPTQGPRTCASFSLSFFLLLACRMYFHAAVVVVTDGLLSRLQQFAVTVVFVLSCCYRRHSTLCLS